MGHFSKVFSRQLPSFIRDEYPQFVSFVKKYFEFVERTQFVNKDMHDLSYQKDGIYVFLDALKQELAYSLPKPIVDEEFLLQKVKELYVSKGSEESLRFLFRAFFNKEIEIFLPSSQILKPSDGTWVQEYSIFVRTILGDPFSTQGKRVSVVNQDNKVTLEVIRVNQSIGQFVSGIGDLDMGYINEIIESIIELGLVPEPVTGELTLPQLGDEYTGDYHELIIDRNYTGKYSVGDIVYFSQNGNIFVGYIVPTISKIEVLRGGKGFRAGQVIDITHDGEDGQVDGSGCKLKIATVGAGGSILSAHMIKYGVEYPRSFMVNLSSDPLVVVSKLYYADENIQLGFTDKITKYESRGYILSDFAYSLNSGSVVNVVFTNNGSNYTGVPNVTVSPSPTGDTAILSPIVENGKIVDFVILNKGSGYITPPTITIDPPIDGDQATTSAILGDVYYSNIDYFGNIESTFSHVTRKKDDEYSDLATIKLVSGPVAKYPGFYANNKSFLSDSICLIDSKYYQDFSYVIKADIPYEEYAQVVLNTTHLAGTKLFAEYILMSDVNIPTSLRDVTSVRYDIKVDDSFIVTDMMSTAETNSGYPYPENTAYISNTDTFGIVDVACIINEPYSVPVLGDAGTYFAEDYTDSSVCNPADDQNQLPDVE
jgi:hypothetical protein